MKINVCCSLNWFVIQTWMQKHHDMRLMIHIYATIWIQRVQNSLSYTLHPCHSPPTVPDHAAVVSDRSGVCCETLCGTSLHGGLRTTSPQERLPQGGPRPCASSPGWPLTHPVCAWWPWRDSGGDFSPAKQRVVIDVAETSALIFCSLTASL